MQIRIVNTAIGLFLSIVTHFQWALASQARVKMVEPVQWLALIRTRASARMNLKELTARNVSELVIWQVSIFSLLSIL